MKLGKISYVDDLRTIWKHEEKEFTPWLADNIFLLGEVLGLDLEVIAVEHNVGSFLLKQFGKSGKVMGYILKSFKMMGELRTGIL